jgi:hypothetical protein
MRNLFLILILLPATTFAGRSPVPDIPPDAGSSFYQARLSMMDSDLNGTPDGLAPVIAAGTRNLNWLNHINSLLPADKKISLSSKETQRGYPIDSPSEYNPQIILANFEELKKTIPAELKKVIYEGGAFTDQPPVSVADYIDWCNKVDRNYQSAGRWRTMAPYLSYLEDRRRQDIRGYYYLSRIPDRAAKLAAYPSLSEKERGDIRGWLIGLCFNDDDAGSVRNCEREVDGKIANKANLETYYQQKEPAGAAMFRTFYAIPDFAPRSEYRWENFAGGSRFVAPFLDPGQDNFRHFLQDNIQDEWRMGDWHLELPFVSSGSNYAHLEFEAGATPHANGLGGDTITMDANQPLTEYDAQWTIRHEFGHILGLPDCYVEFYVSERKTIVNYQLDIDNLMCSRRGHVKAENVDELRRAYSR